MKLLQYIDNLDIGNKVSVRQVAKELSVSDGTAYRAIKDAEAQGLVKTIERVGTVRVEKKQRSRIEKLTYAEVIKIVDGVLLGGKKGLHEALNRFVIGAMKLDEMMKYVEPGNLLIVGNRDDAHRISLERGAAVLITGGFNTTDEVKKLSNQLELPVISSSYDTFTVASLINRSIYDRLIKKEILRVEDVLESHTPIYLQQEDSVSRFYEVLKETGYSHFPVVDRENKVVGMITLKDIMQTETDDRIEKVMTKNPITVTSQTSLAFAAHEMVWQGIELLPVVDSARMLLGVIRRQDVIKSLHYKQKQPQVGETIVELSFRGFKETVREGQTFFIGEVTPQMIDLLGTLNIGVLTMLISQTALRVLRKLRREDLAVQDVTLYHLKPVQVESKIEITPHVFDLSRKQSKMDVEVWCDQKIVAKAMLTAQSIQK